MKVAISNIAWHRGQDAAVADLLAGLGIGGVEIAPTAIWEQPTRCTPSELDAYRAGWNDRGIQIVAIQALLYGHPDLLVFGDAGTRERTLAYLQEMIRVAARLGAGAMVFGSPTNRLRGDLEEARAMEIAAEMFYSLGETADRAGTRLCIEANAPAYGCDFIQTTAEAIELVRQVGHPGFRLHLDTSTMALNGEDYGEVIADGVPLAAHFHVSEPHLEPVGESGSVDHRRVARALHDSGYARWVSIEMRAAGPERSIAVVRESLQFVLEQYLVLRQCDGAGHEHHRSSGSES